MNKSTQYNDKKRSKQKYTFYNLVVSYNSDDEYMARRVLEEIR